MANHKFRFGLRTFLIITTIVSVLVGYFGMKVYREMLREEAVTILEKEGAQLKKDKEQFVTRVLFDNTGMDDEKLKELIPHLQLLPKLQELDLVRVKISDQGLKLLDELDHIKTLYLFQTKASDKGISNLKQRLTSIDIKTTQPDPIASTLIAAVIYPHSIVGLDVNEPGSKFVVGSGDGFVRVFEDNNQIAQWQAHTDWTFTTKFSPDTTMIATGGGDNMIRLWNAQNFKLLAEMSGHLDDVHSIVFSPDGNFLYSAGDDFVIRVWDLKMRRQVSEFAGHTAQIPRIAINDTGTLLASASRDETVKVWNLVTNQHVHTFSGMGCDVMSVAFVGGNRIAAGDESGVFCIWDMNSFEMQTQIQTALEGIFDIASDSTGNSFVACGGGGFQIWDVDHAIQQLVSTSKFQSRIHFALDHWICTNADGQIEFKKSVSLETSRTINTAFGIRGF